MKNWLFLALIFLLSVVVVAEWQLMVVPKQEKLPHFCLIGYSWEVEPFVVSLQTGVGFVGEALAVERKDYLDEHFSGSFLGRSIAVIPAVNVRLEKLSRAKVVPYANIRYSRAYTDENSSLDLPWFIDTSEPDDDGFSYDLLDRKDFWRLGGGVRFKYSESLSLLADYGLELACFTSEEVQYEDKKTIYEEKMQRICVNTYGGLSIVWHW
ncbi:MAG TPA: autotransporter outer membrane beta-barrel domain-containing protein [Firmicutes bacterium]|jgi:hypothetical protein|nr:autotransporter outer membrane beta-barrel domain-containing protein [Bacillota bacterium]